MKTQLLILLVLCFTAMGMKVTSKSDDKELTIKTVVKSQEIHNSTSEENLQNISSSILESLETVQWIKSNSSDHDQEDVDEIVIETPVVVEEGTDECSITGTELDGGKLVLSPKQMYIHHSIISFVDLAFKREQYNSRRMGVEGNQILTYIHEDKPYMHFRIIASESIDSPEMTKWLQDRNNPNGVVPVDILDKVSFPCKDYIKVSALSDVGPNGKLLKFNLILEDETYHEVFKTWNDENNFFTNIQEIKGDDKFWPQFDDIVYTERYTH